MDMQTFPVTLSSHTSCKTLATINKNPKLPKTLKILKKKKKKQIMTDLKSSTHLMTVVEG